MQAEPVQNSQAFQIDPERFKEWFEAPDPDGDFAMPNLPQRIREALGTEATSLVFSAETLAKQKRRHPEITVNDYVGVLNGIPHCNEIYKTRDFHVGLVVNDQKTWAVILKTTVNRMESYMVSLYRLNKDALATFRKAERVH